MDDYLLAKSKLKEDKLKKKTFEELEKWAKKMNRMRKKVGKMIFHRGFREAVKYYFADFGVPPKSVTYSYGPK